MNCSLIKICVILFGLVSCFASSQEDDSNDIADSSNTPMAFSTNPDNILTAEFYNGRTLQRLAASNTQTRFRLQPSKWRDRASLSPGDQGWVTFACDFA